MNKETILKEKEKNPASELEKELRSVFSLKFSNIIVIVIVSAILFTITGIWQLIVVAGFLGGFFTRKGKKGFLVGFMGVFLGWMALFLYYALTTEMLYFFQFWMVETLGITIEWLYLLMMICSAFGGLIGGLGGLNGALVSNIVVNKLSKWRRLN